MNQPKRFFLNIVAFLIASFLLSGALSFSAFAQELGLSVKVSGTASPNRLIYLSVCTTEELRSVTLDIRFDEDALEYKSLADIHAGKSALADNRSGNLSVIYVSDTSVSGELFKLKFKTKMSCDTTLSFHIREAVTPGLSYLSDGESLTLSLSISSSGSVSGSSSKTTKTSSTSSYEDHSDSDTSDDTITHSATLPFFEDDSMLTRTLLFTGATVLLVIIVLYFGYIIGRRTKKVGTKSTTNHPDKPDDTPCEPPTDTDDQAS